MCTDKATELGRRTFSVVRAGSDALEKVVHPRQAAFFDIDEDVSGTRL
jgi:integrin alpha FG-GAP repeat containing protein 1